MYFQLYIWIFDADAVAAAVRLLSLTFAFNLCLIPLTLSNQLYFSFRRDDRGRGRCRRRHSIFNIFPFILCVSVQR